MEQQSNMKFLVLLALIPVPTWLLIAIFLPMLATGDGLSIVGEGWSEASLDAYLGTDSVGRDLLSRLFLATQNSIFLSVQTTLIALFFGAGTAILSNIILPPYFRFTNSLVSAIINIPILVMLVLILPISATSNYVWVIGLCYGLLFYDKSRSHINCIDSQLNIVQIVCNKTATANMKRDRDLTAEKDHYDKRSTIVKLIQLQLLEFNSRYLDVFTLIVVLGFLKVGLLTGGVDLGGIIRDNLGALRQNKIIPVLYPAILIAVVSATLYASIHTLRYWLKQQLDQTTTD